MMNSQRVRQHANQPVELAFSFRATASSNPDAIRDGKSGIVKSVVRTGAGVFTVTFADSTIVSLPRQLTLALANVNGPDSSPTSTTLPAAAYVSGQAINLTARTLEVTVLTANGAGAQAPADPEVGSWVSVLARGPLIDDFKDAL